MDMINLKSRIVEALKTVYDPEIPVNVYDLGLIYDIKICEKKIVTITMTLTAPNCPLADDILNDVVHKVKAVETVQFVKIRLVFEPPWTKEMMSEEALLELGFL